MRQVVQNKVSQLIGREEQKILERGLLVMLIAAMSAGDWFVAHMLIFPRKMRNDQ